MNFSTDLSSARSRGWRSILRELREHQKAESQGMAVSPSRINELVALRQAAREKRAKVDSQLQDLNDDIFRGQYLPEKLPDLNKRQRDLKEAQKALQGSSYLYQAPAKGRNKELERLRATPGTLERNMAQLDRKFRGDAGYAANRYQVKSRLHERIATMARLGLMPVLGNEAEDMALTEMERNPKYLPKQIGAPKTTRLAPIAPGADESWVDALNRFAQEDGEHVSLRTPFIDRVLQLANTVRTPDYSDSMAAGAERLVPGSRVVGRGAGKVLHGAMGVFNPAGSVQGLGDMADLGTMVLFHDPNKGSLVDDIFGKSPEDKAMFGLEMLGGFLGGKMHHTAKGAIADWRLKGSTGRVHAPSHRDEGLQSNKPLDPQYFPDATPDQLQLSETVLNELESNKRRRISLRGLGITRAFRKGRGYMLEGAQVSNAHDLATIAQILRDPRVETMRYVFVKDGRVLSVKSFSSRLAGSSGVWSDEHKFSEAVIQAKLRMEMRRLGADGFWALHNHPTGLAAASDFDLGTTDLHGPVEGFMGHVVINSNEYASIMRNAEGRFERQLHKAEFHKGPDPLHQPAVPNELLGRFARNAEEVAAVGKALKAKRNFLTLIGCTPEGRVQLIADIPIGFLTSMSSKDQILTIGRLRQLAFVSGTHEMFLVVPDGTFNRLLANSKRAKMLRSNAYFALQDNMFEDIVELDSGRSYRSEKGIHRRDKIDDYWWHGRKVRSRPVDIVR